MASSPSYSLPSTLQQQKIVALILSIATILSFTPSSIGCSYTYIFSFGDSFTDTGNVFATMKPQRHGHCSEPPFGDTYFGHPTGRCCDGRLIVDFIAESLRIALVKPYLGIKNGQVRNWEKEDGVNFAILGETAFECKFL